MNELKSKLQNSGKAIAGRFVFPIRPRIQFRRLMVTVTILFVAIAGIQIYLFYRIQSNTIFQAVEAPESKIPAVNEAKLTTVLKRFEDKAVIRSAALELVPAVADPSR
jgi:hypothetical protein